MPKNNSLLSISVILIFYCLTQNKTNAQGDNIFEVGQIIKMNFIEANDFVTERGFEFDHETPGQKYKWYHWYKGQYENKIWLEFFVFEDKDRNYVEVRFNESKELLSVKNDLKDSGGKHECFFSDQNEDYWTKHYDLFSDSNYYYEFETAILHKLNSVKYQLIINPKSEEEIYRYKRLCQDSSKG